MANTNSTAQAGALTFVFLVKRYRNQMINLLVKNGIVVDKNASDEQITSLMVNLLKVSKSYFKDLNDFVTNPAVAQTLMGEIEKTAQYMQASGNGYMNFTDDEIPDDGGYIPPDPALPTPSKTKTTWQGLKERAPEYLSDLIKLVGTYTTNKANTEIAKSRVIVSQNQKEVDEENDVTPPTNKTSTTTIVVLSLVGIAVVGTIIYFIARAKKQ
jgi:hypothetical protein